jgi:hypothetical protein
MDRLINVIGDRPVGVLLHGASVKEMERGIYEVGKGDVCWVSLNSFSMVETNILQKIGDNLSVVALYAEAEIPRQYDNIVKFLQRKQNNLFITSTSILEKIPYYEAFIREFRCKVYLSGGLPIPWSAQRKANSVALLLSEIISSGAKEINIFGMDGIKVGPTAIQEKESYYRHDTLFTRGRFTSIGKDTTDFNKAFPKILDYLRQQGYTPTITNYNPKSYIKVFPRKAWVAP